MKLIDAITGRDNNFNLIRILAALAVLLTHSFPLALGDAAQEPLRASLGMSLGMIAVDVFFITSGFLISASLMRQPSLLSFLWARVLRIFPGLLVMLLFSVFVLGAALSTLPLAEYLASSQTHAYLAQCATLVLGVSYTLPGVFLPATRMRWRLMVRCGPCHMKYTCTACWPPSGSGYAYCRNCGQRCSGL